MCWNELCFADVGYFRSRDLTRQSYLVILRYPEALSKKLLCQFEFEEDWCEWDKSAITGP